MTRPMILHFSSVIVALKMAFHFTFMMEAVNQLTMRFAMRWPRMCPCANPMNKTFPQVHILLVSRISRCISHCNADHVLKSLRASACQVYIPFFYGDRRAWILFLLKHPIVPRCVQHMEMRTTFIGVEAQYLYCNAIQKNRSRVP